MADNLIESALAGQPGNTAAEPSQPEQAAPQQQPQQVNYVTSEQLNAAVDEMKRLVQSSTDKSYNRVQKMIENLKQAGIQNPTYEQAQAMLAQQDQSEQQEQKPEAQRARPSAVSPEAEAWIRNAGGDPTQSYWSDIYDAAQEAGVGIITRDDPEYETYFMQDGKVKQFQKQRQFVRAFEQAFADKKARLSQGNLASSPALGASGGKSSYIDPKSTSANQLITMGLHQ